MLFACRVGLHLTFTCRKYLHFNAKEHVICALHNHYIELVVKHDIIYMLTTTTTTTLYLEFLLTYYLPNKV